MKDRLKSSCAYIFRQKPLEDLLNIFIEYGNNYILYKPS